MNEEWKEGISQKKKEDKEREIQMDSENGEVGRRLDGGRGEK